jgi:hypothetical protein
MSGNRRQSEIIQLAAEGVTAQGGLASLAVSLVCLTFFWSARNGGDGAPALAMPAARLINAPPTTARSAQDPRQGFGQRS